jgi:hypothetical protein
VKVDDRKGLRGLPLRAYMEEEWVTDFLSMPCTQCSSCVYDRSALARFMSWIGQQLTQAFLCRALWTARSKPCARRASSSSTPASLLTASGARTQKRHLRSASVTTPAVAVQDALTSQLLVQAVLR